MLSKELNNTDLMVNLSLLINDLLLWYAKYFDHYYVKTATLRERWHASVLWCLETNDLLYLCVNLLVIIMTIIIINAFIFNMKLAVEKLNVCLGHVMIS